MKKFFNTAKEKVLKIGNRGKKEFAALTAIMATSMPTMVFADGLDMSELISKIVDLVSKIFMYIGVLLAAWSVGMLVLAFKNEDADSKSRAMMMLVVSAALIGIKPLIDGLGLMNYIS